MLDVDYFKKYNDHFGHVEGDKCLVKVAEILTENIQRESDFVARYGGEEFIALMPNTTKEVCMNIALQIIDSFKTAEISHPESDIRKYLTVSIGVHTRLPTESIEDSKIVELADAALYKAKENGRNRVEAL
jgi:diguanylate cyclase (GGDEF)-like protein